MLKRIISCLTIIWYIVVTHCCVCVTYVYNGVAATAARNNVISLMIFLSDARDTRNQLGT